MKKTLIAGFLLWCCVAQAQGIWIEGRLDCGMWLDARSKKISATYEHFIVGMTNGLAIGREIDVWRRKGMPISQEQFFFWMDGYCKNKPLNSALEGALEFANETTEGMFNRKVSGK
jgi:hypothetical protein